MKTECGLTAVVSFKGGMTIEEGSIKFKKCDHPSDLEKAVGILARSIMFNGIPERATEDLSWLLKSTTDWKPAYDAFPQVRKKNGEPLDEVDRYVLTICKELSRHPPLSHENVESVTVRYARSPYGGQCGSVTFTNKDGEASGNWLRNAVVEGYHDLGLDF